jgi:hypothetical protein
LTKKLIYVRIWQSRDNIYFLNQFTFSLNTSNLFSKA